ncbi:FAD binding domain-containing protein [Pseudorhodoplanes sp.]|uniref:FAD binding domain-containing protein n=1 Tax=Pseudorhodoplanes sp. TaxID=1934341 RepID=UPI00391DEF82
MKPAPFDYIRPDSLEEVCAILAADEGARIIAGGQTLVPMLAMRLARPSRLVDIQRLRELSDIREDNSAIVIGAATRQAIAEKHDLVATRLPLLAKALPWVGHPPTRNRGTVGGSIAHADPSAEIPLVSVTLDAEIVLHSEGGMEIMLANDFFVGPMVTAIPMGACLTAVRFPVWADKRIGVGFHEISARRSDFAFVSAAAQVAVDAAGVCARCAIGIGGAGDRPVRLDGASAALVGTKLSDREIRDAVAGDADQLETISDLHASADYRRRVAAVLAGRAVIDAREAALGVLQ